MVFLLQAEGLVYELAEREIQTHQKPSLRGGAMWVAEEVAAAAAAVFALLDFRFPLLEL